ncbi:MAG TPA: hypothetical protein VMY76_08720, partial [Gemmatimonadales bacterium]|nr:hypothetical protein [Gemmatimonadales bacterium]
PPALDAALRLGEHLARKAALPGRTGLGAEGLRLWRWRAALADRLGRGLATVGTAVVRMCSEENAWLHTPGCLAGFELLEARSGGAMRLAAVVGWLDAVGRWTEDEGEITGRLEAAARAQDGGCPSPARLDTALTMLMGPIRSRLALVGARRWTAAEPQPAARRLATRLGERVREAARRRDAGALTCLEAALAFAAGGHTAGEARLVRRLAECEPPELARALTRLPAPTRGWGTIEVRLTGLILFER